MNVFIIYILIVFASDCIEMYIKPNTTAAVACPYKGNQIGPIFWRNYNKSIAVGDTVGDGEGKFRISGSYGAGKSILQIVNFSVRDEGMYSCLAIIGEQIVEQCFNIHVCVFAYDCIEIYIKPNTTAEVVCPYEGNQKTPITWKKTNKLIGVGNTVGDGEGKFRIYGSYGAGKSILQIVNFSVRDEDMYRCSAIIGEQILEQFFNIHVCDVPLEMNLYSETDNTLDEHLKNVLCTVDDTAIATTQVHSSTNEESINIRGIIQNVTCSVLNMDQCITANITLQLQLTWSGIEDPSNTVSGSEKEPPTSNSFHNITYGNCSYPVSCNCGSFLSRNNEKHIFKGFFKNLNLFLKNFESLNYCDCIIYIHKCQRQVTSGSHVKLVYFVSVLSISIAMLSILTAIGVYLL